MFWMRTLNYTNNYLKQLSLFEKVLIYAFPLIVFLATIVLMDFTQPKEIKVQSQIVQLKEQIKQLEAYEAKPTMFAIVLDDLENYALDKKLSLNSIKIFDRSINLTVKGELKSLVGMIDYCETYDRYSKVKSLDMGYDEQEKLNSLNIVVSFDKAYIKPKNNPQELHNELQSLENVFAQKSKEIIPLKLSAIVGNHVLINDQWLLQNESIKGYKVAQIEQHQVTMKKDNESMLLTLFND